MILVSSGSSDNLPTLGSDLLRYIAAKCLTTRRNFTWINVEDFLHFLWGLFAIPIHEVNVPKEIMFHINFFGGL